MKKLIIALSCVLLALGGSGVSAQSAKEKEIEGYIKTLESDKDAKKRAAAANAIGEVAQLKFKLAKPAEPALLKGVKDGDAGVRRASVMALAYFDTDPQMLVPMLVGLLDEKQDRTVRVAAAGTLGALGRKAKDAVPVLAEIKKKEDAKDQKMRDGELLGRVNQALQSIGK